MVVTKLRLRLRGPEFDDASLEALRVSVAGATGAIVATHDAPWGDGMCRFLEVQHTGALSVPEGFVVQDEHGAYPGHGKA